MSSLPSHSCPECGAGYGDPHWPGCGYSPGRLSDLRDAVAGREVTAVSECRRRGWAVAYVPGEGLRPCRPDEPGAYIDLDRYAYWLAYGDPDVDGNDPGVEADEG